MIDTTMVFGIFALVIYMIFGIIFGWQWLQHILWVIGASTGSMLAILVAALLFI